MSATPEFAVSVHDLDAAGKQVRLPVRAAWLRGALEGTDVRAAGSDGEVDVRLSKSGTDVVVRGTVRADLQVPCARCLEPAHVAVREELSALVVPHGAAPVKAEPEEEGLGEAGDVLSYDGETVVLDELIRDELLLAVPMIPLCSEACPGIRPEPPAQPAAAARGVDPRLRPLLRLKKRTT